MIAKIKELELESRKLETNLEQRNKWLSKIQDYTNQFIEGLDQGKAFEEAWDEKDFFSNLDLNKGIQDLDEILKILDRQVDQIGLNPASGGHLGYIPGGGIYPTSLGDYMAAVTNRYSGIFFGGPGAVRLENSLIKWMCRMIGYPSSAHGNLTSGGSIANLIAVTTARDKKNIKSKMVEDAVIYVSDQTHHSVHKAIRIAGLDESHLRRVPLDTQQKMDIESLNKMLQHDTDAGLKPFLIVASAGTTDTGSVDPLDRIADLAAEFDCWFHVDAAYGGFFIMIEKLQDLFKGIDRADSVVMDPHKGLFLSYGLGAVVIKDVEAMFQSHFYKASYMQDAQEKYTDLSPADLSPELTKHFRGLRLWLPLMLHGIEPFRAGLEEKHYLALYFYEEIQKRGFEVLNVPELSVVVYRYLPTKHDADIFNQELIDQVHSDGRVFLSSTTINGVIWLRAAILSFRTHKHIVDRCLEMIDDCVVRTHKVLSA